MPYPIVESRWLSPAVRWMVVQAPHVTRNYKPGQFVILRATPGGERIPLTIARADRDAGTVLLIVQAIGASTTALTQLEAGQCVPDIAGPLGMPTHIKHVGHAIVAGGGVGTAVVYPQGRALVEAGNRVTAIVGGRSREYVILEKELAELGAAVLPCTDDGSHGFHGFVTDRLRQVIETDRPALVLCAGPLPMMRAVAEVTRPYGVETVASLNPIMVDGTGMCGGCRVRVGGEVMFACVDGPEFDAHAVDFKELGDRLTAYREHEQHVQYVCQSQAALAGAGVAS